MSTEAWSSRTSAPNEDIGLRISREPTGFWSRVINAELGVVEDSGSEFDTVVQTQATTSPAPNGTSIALTD